MRPFPMVIPYNGMYDNGPFDMRYPFAGNPYSIPSLAHIPQDSFFNHGDVYPPTQMSASPYFMYQNGGNAGAPPYGQVISSGYNQQHPYGPTMNPQQGYFQPYNSANAEGYGSGAPPVYPPGNPNQPMQGMQPQVPYMPQPMNVGGNFSPFANPLQPSKAKQALQSPYPNPYPKQAFMQKSQPSGFKSIMNQFKTQDGTIDVTKMMNTAGQMMGTVNQMQGMFKGLGGLLKLT